MSKSDLNPVPVRQLDKTEADARSRPSQGTYWLDYPRYCQAIYESGQPLHPFIQRLQTQRMFPQNHTSRGWIEKRQKQQQIAQFMRKLFVLLIFLHFLLVYKLYFY